MGKHSDLERKDRDFYSTPMEPTAKLVPHLKGVSRYYEPFAGDGRLINNLCSLEPYIECMWASDIEPQAEGIEKLALDDIDSDKLSMGMIQRNADIIISNPPWLNTNASGFQLFRFVNKLCNTGFPVVLLLNANIINNKSSWQNKMHGKSLMDLCYQILPVGRIKWIDNSPFSAKEDSAWFFFSDTNNSLPKILPRT